MSVDRNHAERIAHLARLRFEDEELGRITADLNRILQHVESLEAMDTDGDGGAAANSSGRGGDAVEPAGGGHLATGGAPTVVDCAPTRGAGAETPDLLARDLSAVAPDWREGFFVVPPLPGVHDPEGA